MRDDGQVDILHDELLNAYYKPDLVKAREIAEKLASALGVPTKESVKRHPHSWILIWETRGNREEAGRIQNQDIARKRAEIEAGDYNDCSDLLREQIEYLQNSLYFQAIRYKLLKRIDAALECLREVYELGERYGIDPDEDTRDEFDELLRLRNEKDERRNDHGDTAP